MLSLYEELRGAIEEKEDDGPVSRVPAENDVPEVKLEIVLEHTDTSQSPADDRSEIPIVVENPGLPHDASLSPAAVENPGLPRDLSESPAAVENPGHPRDLSESPAAVEIPGLPHDPAESPAAVENPGLPHDLFEYPAVVESPGLLDDRSETPAVQEKPGHSYDTISLSGRVWGQPSPGCVPPSWCVREQEEETRQMARQQEERINAMADKLVPAMPWLVDGPRAEVLAEDDMTDCITDGSTDPEVEFGYPGPRNMDCTDTLTDSTDTVPH